MCKFLKLWVVIQKITYCKRFVPTVNNGNGKSYCIQKIGDRTHHHDKELKINSLGILSDQGS